MSTQPTNGDAWTRRDSPFHEGEVEIQKRLGVAAKSERLARRLFYDHLPDAHRNFFASLPYCFLGSVDPGGWPRATMIWGEKGFIDARSERLIDIAGTLGAADPAGPGLALGSMVGVLGLDLATRVRFRTNGTILSRELGKLSISVEMSYPSCQQYIQARTYDGMRPVAEPGAEAPTVARTLDARSARIIAECDTYFIASACRPDDSGIARNADISHRGGRRGFVRVDEGGALTTPDYSGNFVFNTLGNILREQRVGLLFVDFDSGDVLQIGARAEIIWEGEEVDSFVGAERMIRFHIEDVVLRPQIMPLRFGPPDFSPVLTRTGSWDGARQAMEANRQRETWRPFRVSARVVESDVITSFVLAPADGAGIAPYQPGQHLPVAVVLPDGREEVRSYSLSSAQNPSNYRISVKREPGGVSDWLHDEAVPGTVVKAKAPRGSFTYQSEAMRPLMLISAGVGLTPMIAILDTVLIANGRSLHHAPIVFLHGARDGAAHAFRDWTNERSRTHANLTVHYAYSRPRPSLDFLGCNHHSEGRVGIAHIAQLKPSDDCDYYLCGPADFMQDMYGGLRDLGVADARIFAESFGPSQLRRTSDPAGGDPLTTAPVDVSFARSGQTATWHPGAGSLLDLAESIGLEPVHSCRIGNCGSCRVRLVSGAVEYESRPVADVRDGFALICCARPRATAPLADAPGRIVLDM